MSIVVLDDNQHTLSLVRSVLRSLGVENVRCYLRPESALAAIEAKPPQIVLTDWELGPAMSGLEFVRMLRASKNAAVGELPIIMLTAHSDLTLVKAARDAGIDGFIVKPFSAKTLAQRIAAIRRRQHAAADDVQDGAELSDADGEMMIADGAGAAAMPSRADVIAAEARLAELRGRFEASLAAYVAELAAAAGTIQADPAAIGRCRKLAHDLKGQGTSFGYPLLTEFAGSLTQLLMDGRADDPLLGQLVALHIKAIGAVAQARITGDGGETGRALREGFSRSIARVTGKA
ncbi:MAG: response regulator [Alphaproteobacteria bacterium]|jgi:DNA-binding response OmpR family regulator|nr:response regulator [Alphaproteobacteria bacterium]